LGRLVTGKARKVAEAIPGELKLAKRGSEPGPAEFDIAADQPCGTEPGAQCAHLGPDSAASKRRRCKTRGPRDVGESGTAKAVPTRSQPGDRARSEETSRQLQLCRDKDATVWQSSPDPAEREAEAERPIEGVSQHAIARKKTGGVANRKAMRVLQSSAATAGAWLEPDANASWT